MSMAISFIRSSDYNGQVMTIDDSSNSTDEDLPLDVFFGDEEYYMEYPSIKAVFIACYAVIFLVGVLSNGILLIVGLRNYWHAGVNSHASHHSNYNSSATVAVTNLLVANLAAGDIVLCLFSAPSTPFSYYFHTWPLGEFACRFLPSTLITAVCVISFTSTVLAVDRHLAICYPAEKRLTVRWAYVTIVLIWLVAIVCSVPSFITQQLTNDEEGNDQCRENWPSTNLQRLFSTSTLVIQFGIPFAVIFYCYGAVFLVIRSQDAFRSKTATVGGLSVTKRVKVAVETPDAVSETNESKNCFSGVKCGFVSLIFDARFMRTTRILIAMISVFMACWLPINFLHLVQDYLGSDLWSSTRWYSLAYFSAHVLALSSTLWNPLLYGWMNENFRKELVRAFSFLKIGDTVRSDSDLDISTRIRVDDKFLSPRQTFVTSATSLNFLNSPTSRADLIEPLNQAAWDERPKPTIASLTTEGITSYRSVDEATPLEITVFDHFKAANNYNSIN